MPDEDSTAVATPPRSLRRNFSASLLGNVVYTATQFGMLLALAQVTTPLEVGRYGLALAVTAPIFIFAGLKLRQVQVTDAAGVNQPGDYYGLRLVTSALALAAVVAIALLGPWPPATVWTLIAVAAFKAFEAQTDIFNGSLQRREQMQLVARSQIFRGVIGLIVFVAVLLWTERVEVAATGLAAVAALQVLFSAHQVRQLGVSVRPTFAPQVMRRLAWLALPLGVAVSIGSLLVNVPRYVIEAQLDTAALGVFAVLGYSLVATGTIAGSLAEAASPRLANLYVARRGAQFKATLARLVAVGAALGLTGIAVAALLGEPVLRLLFGQEYAEETGVLVVLMVAAALQYTALFLGTSVNAMRLFTVQMPINAAGLVVVTLVALVAVPTVGLVGAALAAVAGQLVQGLAYLYLLRRVVLPRLREAA